MRKKPHNIKLMYWSFIFGGMLFFLPVIALYFEESLFTITNVALIYAIEAFAIVLFEVPSGAVADLFGRKKSIVLGNVVVLIGLIFLSIGGSMLMFIVYAILSAFGRSLVSGADSAVIYDSLQEVGRESEYEKTIGTYYAMWTVGATFSSLIGGHLAVYSLQYPVLLTFVPLLITTGIVLFLREPSYKKEEHRNIFLLMRDTVQFALSKRNFVIILVAAFFIIGFGENLFMLGALFLEAKEIPIELIGYTVAAITALIAVGEFYGSEISKKFGRKRTMIFIGLFGALLFIGATFATPYLAAVLLTLPALLFGFRHTIISGMLNEGVDSAKRATMVSLWSFCGELGIAIGAPFIGWLADWYDITVAFRISACIVLIVPVLYLFLQEKSRV